MSFKIRPAEPGDLDAIRQIERGSPTAAHWTDRLYEEVFTSATVRRIALVAAFDASRPAESQVIGFLIAREISPDWEVENIVTSPQHLWQGVADALFCEFMSLMNEERAQAVFLEVRESNLPARALYLKWNFKESGKRRGYYRDPSEDAIVYRLDLHQLA